MNIGRMDKRIELNEPVSKKDGRGGLNVIFEPRATVWAELKNPTTKTTENTGTVVSELVREIAIRYRADVRKGWIVIFNGRKFSIEHTYDIGRKEKTMLVCKEVHK